MTYKEVVLNKLNEAAARKRVELKEIEEAIETIQRILPDEPEIKPTPKKKKNDSVTSESVKDRTQKQKSKYKGVSKTSRGDKWRAQFYIKGKGVIQLKDKNGNGSFGTEEEAHQVYEDFKEQYENNQDRAENKRKYTKKEHDHDSGQNDKIQIERWECMKCKRRYTTSQMPVRCVPECGSINFNMI